MASLAWVTLADLCLDSDQWSLVAGVLSSQPRCIYIYKRLTADSRYSCCRRLRRLELVQLLGLTEDSGPHIAQCCRVTPEVAITAAGSLGGWTGDI